MKNKNTCVWGLMALLATVYSASTSYAMSPSTSPVSKKRLESVFYPVDSYTTESSLLEKPLKYTESLKNLIEYENSAEYKNLQDCRTRKDTINNIANDIISKKSILAIEKLVTSISEIEKNDFNNEKTIQNRKDNIEIIKTVIHKIIKSLQIPSVINLSKNTVNQEDEIVVFWEKLIKSFKKNSSLFTEIMTSPTESSIILKQFERSTEPLTAVDLITKQISYNKCITDQIKNSFEKLENLYNALQSSKDRSIFLKYKEAAEKYKKNPKLLKNQDFLKKYENVMDKLKIYANYCNKKAESESAFQNLYDEHLKKYEKEANELKKDKNFLKNFPKELSDFQLKAKAFLQNRRKFLTDKSAIVEEYTQYQTIRKNKKKINTQNYKKFLHKNRAIINLYNQYDLVYEAYEKYKEIYTQYQSYLDQFRQVDQEVTKNYNALIKQANELREKFNILQQYDKIIREQHKCLKIQVIPEADSTGELTKIMAKAIKDQNNKYSSHKMIPIPSQYKKTDEDSPKKFYGLDYGFLG